MDLNPSKATLSKATLALARPMVECAQCGKHLFAPEWSEYLDARHVRHLWACEACDYSFETLVCFPELQAA